MPFFGDSAAGGPPPAVPVSAPVPERGASEGNGGAHGGGNAGARAGGSAAGRAGAWLAAHPMPLLFLVLCAVGIRLAGLSLPFVAEEVLTRLCRDTVLALALILPITAGMGLNFALPVGAMAAQGGLLIAACAGLSGGAAVGTALAVALPLAALLGALIGMVLNRVKGREMIVSIVIGLLGSNLYQLLCLGVPGRLIAVANPSVLLSKGSGLRNSVDLEFFRHILRNVGHVTVGGVSFSVGSLVVVLLFAAAVHWLLRSRFGLHARAGADDRDRAALCGIVPDRVRLQAMVLSTVLGACGQLIYIQDLSILNVYTGHLLSDIFAAAALLAGGATLRSATVGQAVLGVLLFHTLFVVSPMAGQNTLSNAAIGEYCRSFIAYGVIALAILLNRRKEGISA